MSQPKKNITEIDLFSDHLGTKTRQIISQLLEHNEKLQQENQRLQDEVQKIKDKNVVSEEPKKNRFYTKVFTKRFFEPSPKFIHWFKLLSKFISVQLIVQVLNLASGILIIRTLSKQEYAYFTLANAMQAAMNVLADSGIGSALSTIGGRVWQDPYRFGQLINTAMYLRRYLAVITTLVVTPILFWMLLQNGASIGYTVILIVGILVELYFYLEIGVLSTVLRLHTEIDRIQRLALSGAGSRLAILGAAFNFLNAGVGVFASTITSCLQVLMLRSWSNNIIATKAVVSQDDQKEILKIVVSQVPNSIYFCVQSQLAVFLISIFGNTQNIAEIGALSRLGVIFSIITSVITEIVLPNFARCQTPNILFRKYLQILGAYCIFSIALVGLAFLFPSQFLWILGGKYSHLQGEVVLLVINLVMQSILGLTWSLNSSRGWIISGWLSIPIGILTQVLLLTKIDVSTIKGIFMLNTISTLPGFVLLLYVAYSGFSKMKSEMTSL